MDRIVIAGVVSVLVACGGKHATTPSNSGGTRNAPSADASAVLDAFAGWEVESDAPGGTMSIAEDALGGVTFVRLWDLRCAGEGDGASCDARPNETDEGTYHLDGQAAARILEALRGFDPAACDDSGCHAAKVDCERHPADENVDSETKTTDCDIE